MKLEPTSKVKRLNSIFSIFINAATPQELLLNPLFLEACEKYGVVYNMFNKNGKETK